MTTNDLTRDALRVWAENATDGQIVEWEELLKRTRRGKRTKLRADCIEAVAKIVIEQGSHVSAMDFTNFSAAVKARIETLKGADHEPS